MPEAGPIRWWRVASHLWRPAGKLAGFGAVATGLLAALFLLSPPVGYAGAVLMAAPLLVACAASAVGLALLLFAALAIVIGRAQWAIWSWRSSGGKRVSDGAGPYR